MFTLSLLGGWRLLTSSSGQDSRDEVKMSIEDMYLESGISPCSSALSSHPVCCCSTEGGCNYLITKAAWGLSFFLFKYVCEAICGWYRPRVEEGVLQF